VSRRRTVGLFATAALAYGTSFVAIKSGLATLPPALFAALRFEIAAPFVLAYVALRSEGREWLPRTRSDVLALAGAGAFLVWFNGLFLFVGQQFTTSAAAAVGYSVLPVATPLVALALLPEERISRLGAVGIALGFVGVVVMVRPDPATVLAGGRVVGQLLVVVAAVAVALGSVLVRRIRPRLGILALTGWAMVVGGLATHATSLALGEPRLASLAWTGDTLLAVVYVGLVATAVAFPAYFTLIDEVGAIRANLISYVVPVVAAVTGVVVLGEAIDTATVAGFVFVAAAFGLLQHETLAADLRALRARVEEPATPPPGDD
jgi:drug/metabolite transporter (DMT)-like permease